MTNTIEIENIFSLALQLSPAERIQLIERIAASVGQDIRSETNQQKPVTGHWGQELVALIEELGPIDMLYPEIEYPVEWVKRLREDQDKKRNLDWGEED